MARVYCYEQLGYRVITKSRDWILCRIPYFWGDGKMASAVTKFDSALIWQVVIATWLKIRKRKKYSFNRGIIMLYFGENTQVPLYPFLRNHGILYAMC